MPQHSFWRADMAPVRTSEVSNELVRHQVKIAFNLASMRSSRYSIPPSIEPFMERAYHMRAVYQADVLSMITGCGLALKRRSPFAVP